MQLRSVISIVVPPMAESLSEGTLSQIAKSVGDTLELDEEFATIETDKVRIGLSDVYLKKRDRDRDREREREKESVCVCVCLSVLLNNFFLSRLT